MRTREGGHFAIRNSGRQSSNTRPMCGVVAPRASTETARGQRQQAPSLYPGNIIALWNNWSIRSISKWRCSCWRLNGRRCPFEFCFFSYKGLHCVWLGYMCWDMLFIPIRMLADCSIGTFLVGLCKVRLTWSYFITSLLLYESCLSPLMSPVFKVRP